MPDLVIERGREKGLSFKLQPGAENVIGRDPASVQVVISDVASSRRHFNIFVRGSKWYVADLGSRNGTFLNEEKVDGEVELNSGDRVQVGETVFSFLEEEKAEPGKAGGLQGKEIGGYEIMERIGRGGMGTVYKARQKSMHRVVALKFLSPKLSQNPAFVNQFRAEARAAGQLNHPNVVQALDVFELNGLHCFSMEFMEGGCVQDLLSKREDSRLPWEEALPLLVDATRGLVFAEKRGIIHRDIKPDNLMLTVEQKVKIGDLGLAKSATELEGSGAAAGGPATGIFGTPHFIAPEQAQGKPVSHPADIYALGATFYRMVSGRTPFSGATVKEILRAQINEPHKPLVEVVPDFPRDLSVIVDKMMAKKVDERYQSASKLLEDLETFLLNHQIELAGGVKSRKPFVILIGVLVLVAAGVILWAVTRDPEVIKDTQVRTVTIEVQPAGEIRTPEQIQDAYDREAQIDFLQIQGDDRGLGKLEEGLAKKDDWIRIAVRYEALRGKHPEADPEEHVKEAKDRATVIRETIQSLEQQKTQVLDKAAAWWRDTKRAIDEALAARKWAEAIRLSGEAKRSPEWELYKPHVDKGAENFLGSTRNTASSAVANDVLTLQADVTKLEGERSYKDAVEKMLAFETALEKEVHALGALNEQDRDARFAQQLDGARKWRDAKEVEFRKALVMQLDDDRTLFVDAYRAIRHLPRDAADTGGPVFLFRFGDAAKDLRAATDGKLLTYLYRDRAEEKARQLGEMQAAWDEWMRLLADRKLFAAGEEFKGMPGAEKGEKFLFDAERPPTATEVFYVKTIGGGQSKQQRAWAEFDPTELWKVFVYPKLDRLAPEHALQLARLFAELAEADAMHDLLEKASTVPGDKSAIRNELSARQAFGYISANNAGSPDAVQKAVAGWKTTWRTTDMFILLDGREGKYVEEKLFPDDADDSFFMSWGKK